MNVDIARGLKRVFLSALVIWFFVFAYFSYDELSPKSAIVWTDNMECSKLIELLKSDKTLDRMTTGNLRDYQKFFDEGKIKNLDLIDSDGTCKYKFTYFFKDRITKSSKEALNISLIPIPLYFFTMFIINGFRRKDH